jgi:FAD/FMN-containing dehydrogenase
MGSEASARLGGALSTNAGGLNVLRHGMAREQVLGLEVVLPDGALLSDLSALRKDNAGYDLKQLFIGAEGTLGIITCATLRLQPLPRTRATVFATAPDLAAACLLFAALRDRFGPGLAAFEYLASDALARVLAGTAKSRHPLAGDPGDAVLMDLVSHELTEVQLQAELAAFLSDPAVATLSRDAAVAASEAQRAAWWTLRERVPAVERAAGGSIKHDIAIEISRLPELARQVMDTLHRRWPQARLSVFGHVGDGNLHFNVMRGEGAPATPADEDALTDAIHACVAGLGGSFSAEHGIGQLKRATLAQLTSPPRLALMKSIKQALDPRNLMNPGKVV